jgi:hypothetical protein
VQGPARRASNRQFIFIASESYIFLDFHLNVSDSSEQPQHFFDEVLGKWLQGYFAGKEYLFRGILHRQFPMLSVKLPSERSSEIFKQGKLKRLKQ